VDQLSRLAITPLERLAQQAQTQVAHGSISISGNAATVTNGLYSTGSYSNPTWLTSISGSIVSGAVATATTATNVAGGATGSLVLPDCPKHHFNPGAWNNRNYVLSRWRIAHLSMWRSPLCRLDRPQHPQQQPTWLAVGLDMSHINLDAGATSFVTAGTTGQVLTSNGSSAPTWSTPASSITLSDDTTTNATRYPLFAAATSGTVSTEYVSSTKYSIQPVYRRFDFYFVYRSWNRIDVEQRLSLNRWKRSNRNKCNNIALNLAGGANGSVPYQTGSGATTFLAAGTNGYVLTLAAGVPTWAAAAATGITISDDTTTNATRYLTFTSATTGSITSENVSSTKLKYNPSTGELSAPVQISSNGININSTTVAASYTIGSGFNGMSVGPMTVASGQAVTVATNQRWLIL